MNHSKIILPSNRKFGLFFSVVFSLIASYFFYLENNFWFYIFGLLALVFIIITLINNDFLGPLNKLWFKFGLLLGKIVSPVVMGLIFFGIFTPIAIFMRLIGRDELRLKFKNQSTHWIKRKTSNQSEFFKRQF